MIIAKISYLLLFMLLLLNNIIAQLTYNDLEKYWFYKDRFNKYFVKVGDDIGESIVCSRRNHNGGTNFRLGDQTSHLGWYIGVLATEYKLLNDNGYSTENTLTELYYALKAYERLDYCEANPPWNLSTSKVDGFFMRFDPQLYDHPELFDTTGLNNGCEKPTDSYGSRYPGMPTYIDEVLIEEAGQDHIVMTQDQAIYIIMGLALVRKCLPNSSLIVKDLNGNYIPFNFHSMSKYYANNIIEYIQNRNLIHGPQKWHIYEPDGGLLQRPGGNVYAFAYPLYKTGQKIFNYTYTDSWSTSPLAKDMWRVVNIPIWKTDNAHMSCVLAALSDTWDIGINSTGYNIHMVASDHQRNWDTFYLLLYNFIQDKNSSYFDNTQAKDQITTAPLCGPYLWDANNDVYFDCCGYVEGKPDYGWASGLKFIHSNDAQHGYDDNTTNTRQQIGNFNGLDYMLFYNLYKLVEDPEFYPNLINREVFEEAPYSWYGICKGWTDWPFMYQAFESIESSGKIKNNCDGDQSKPGDVTYRAGKNIVLMPGFQVEHGAKFKAYIESYSCDGAGYNKSGQSGLYSALPMVNAMDSLFVNENYRNNKYKLNQVRNNINSEIDSSLNNLGVHDMTCLIYPNPSHGIININIINYNNEPLNVAVINMIGVTIYSKKYQQGNRQTISLSSYPDGFYFISIECNDKVFKQKISLNK
ncbi:MAG: hypothetical protein Kow0068_01580 [Marinilabiliales bacterium]